MSKYLLRLIVVIAIIVVATVTVYLIVNKPDESKKIYDEYISLIEEDGYQNYEYLTKEFTISSASYVTSLNVDAYIKAHYRVTNAIKEDIELNLMLLDYVVSYDDVAQEDVLDAIRNFNSITYGTDGVTYQARYLYEYYDAGNFNTDNVDALLAKLRLTMHQAEVAGSSALTILKNYVQTYVYVGNQPEDIRYVLYDARALVASAIANSYENVSEDKLHEVFDNYDAYMTKLETLISSGELNGYNTLVTSSSMNFIDSYNALDEKTLIGLFNAQEKTTYIDSQTDENVKAHLSNIVTYLEATNE